jgi:hypothetical protein
MGNACTRSESEDPNTITSIKIGPDYQEIPEKLAGTGIKATVSWQATITRGQLNEKREEFWRSRTEGNRRTWMAIKAAVEADAATALTIIQNNNIKMKKGSITLLEDSEGFIYNIPVFMVNNPIAFHKEKKVKPREVKKIEENIKLKIRKPGVAHDFEFEVKNTCKVSELKEIYAEKAGFKAENVKFFFGGKEIKDHETLAKNFIENEMVVQAFVKN